MAKQYVTSQGDTWDAIAYKVYGDEVYMKNLIEANQDYAGVFVFSGGILIDLPEIKPEDKPDAIPFWRRMTDAQMNAEEGEDDYTDEEDEDEEEGDYPEEDDEDE